MTGAGQGAGPLVVSTPCQSIAADAPGQRRFQAAGMSRSRSQRRGEDEAHDRPGHAAAGCEDPHPTQVPLLRRCSSNQRPHPQGVAQGAGGHGVASAPTDRTVAFRHGLHLSLGTWPETGALGNGKETGHPWRSAQGSAVLARTLRGSLTRVATCQGARTAPGVVHSCLGPSGPCLSRHNPPPGRSRPGRPSAAS